MLNIFKTVLVYHKFCQNVVFGYFHQENVSDVDALNSMQKPLLNSIRKCAACNRKLYSQVCSAECACSITLKSINNFKYSWEIIINSLTIFYTSSFKLNIRVCKQTFFTRSIPLIPWRKCQGSPCFFNLCEFVMAIF